MYIPISIDRNSAKPIYRQVMSWIIENIEKEHLKYGSKLPTERELSADTKISRGTVKKAYEELEKIGVIKIIWGSGAYIVKKDTNAGENDENAIMEKLVNTLLLKGYTPREIEVFAKIRLDLGQRRRRVTIAAVECNIEGLKICHKQLAVFPESQCHEFLINELKGFSDADRLFKDFDIIFTTPDHYDELIKLIPENAFNVISAAVSPDSDSLIKVTNITSGTRVGAYIKSRRFREIIGITLAGNGLRIPDKDCIYERWTSPDDLKKFLTDKDTLIMPPLYVMDIAPDIYEVLKCFLKRGGDVINLNYVIEKASLIYIEEKIKNILYNVN
ncbi:MAG: GntR family transcriptional regulator [Clostridiales bacterium]|jgi:DNA-binding transcriptional regulator YhcF (GntR family)|nr:GntR family transcriptional regulator [Clostridiales bacterium]